MIQLKRLRTEVWKNKFKNFKDWFFNENKEIRRTADKINEEQYKRLIKRLYMAIGMNL